MRDPPFIQHPRWLRICLMMLTHSLYSIASQPLPGQVPSAPPYPRANSADTSIPACTRQRTVVLVCGADYRPSFSCRGVAHGLLLEDCSHRSDGVTRDRRICAQAWKAGTDHARRTMGIRMTLLTTERIFWHGGAHAAEPKIVPIGAILPIPYLPNICCFRWRVAGAPKGCGRGRASHAASKYSIGKMCEWCRTKLWPRPRI